MIENFDKEKCLDIYRLLKMDRRFEQKTLELSGQGEILGSLHVGVGQEAVHVGIALALKEGDVAFRTHRDSGQMIAEGIDPKYLFAELMGKINGYCMGLGGSLHLPVISGVLGANVPIASGAALAFKIRNEKRVAIGQYGDGASNLGPLHEAMNMAAIWKLPAVFICENNGYAVTTSIKYSSLLENLSDRGKAWGIPGETVDGMDVMAVYKAASRLIERARSGEGPAILECKTYRYEDHSKSTANLVLSYRSKDEIAEWMEKDAIGKWAARLLDEKVCTQEELDKIDELVEKTLEEAVEFARNSPLPEPEDAFRYMYASRIEGIPQKGW